MDLNNLVNTFSQYTPKELQQMLCGYLATLPPDEFERRHKHYDETLRNSGKEAMLQEVVCRLVAAGMPVEEIALVLSRRVDDVNACANDATVKKYAKTLKQRRAKKEQSGK